MRKLFCFSSNYTVELRSSTLINYMFVISSNSLVSKRWHAHWQFWLKDTRMASIKINQQRVSTIYCYVISKRFEPRSCMLFMVFGSRKFEEITVRIFFRIETLVYHKPNAHKSIEKLGKTVNRTECCFPKSSLTLWLSLHPRNNFQHARANERKESESRIISCLWKCGSFQQIWYIVSERNFEMILFRFLERRLTSPAPKKHRTDTPERPGNLWHCAPGGQERKCLDPNRVT